MGMPLMGSVLKLKAVLYWILAKLMKIVLLRRTASMTIALNIVTSKDCVLLDANVKTGKMQLMDNALQWNHALTIIECVSPMMNVQWVNTVTRRRTVGVCAIALHMMMLLTESALQNMVLNNFVMHFVRCMASGLTGILKKKR